MTYYKVKCRKCGEKLYFVGNYCPNCGNYLTDQNTKKNPYPKYKRKMYPHSRGI